MTQDAVQSDLDIKLVAAVQSRNEKDVIQLLLQGANVHVCDDQPLRTAIRHGYVNIVKILVSAGSDAHVRCDYPLRLAIAIDNHEIAWFLIQNGANIDALPFLQRIRYRFAMFLRSF